MMRLFLLLITINFMIFAEDVRINDHNQQEAKSNFDYSKYEKDKHVISLANLEGEPSAFVNNCVNVITGDYNEQQVDFAYAGVEPLMLERSYTSSDFYEGSLHWGWHFNLLNKIEMDMTYERGSAHFTSYANLREGSSQILLEHSNRDKNKPYQASGHSLKKGLVNRHLSGQGNIKNIKIKSDGEDILKLTDGFGAIKHFKSTEDLNESSFYLTKEAKPTGLFREYNYNKKHRLESVLTKNANGKIINTFLFEYKPNQSSQERKLEVYSLDGRSVKYSFAKMKKGKYFLTEVDSHQFPKETFEYEKKQDTDDDFQLNKKIMPEGHFQSVRYYHSGNNQFPRQAPIKIKNYEDPRNGRVRLLRAPAGTDNSEVVTHAFNYKIYEDYKTRDTSGYTEVFDAHGNLSKYFWNKDHRLTSLEKFATDGALHCRERFYWGDVNNKINSTNLLAKTAEPSSGSPLFAKTYSYDEHGNVIEDRLYGNLTGNNLIVPALNADGSPNENCCECYKKNYFYSADGKNLLLYETDGRKAVSYVYKAGTDLLAAKLLACNGAIYRRHFYLYDVNSSLVEEFLDDGSGIELGDLTGVTERYINSYSPRTEYPIGLPEVVEDSYIDFSTNAKCLIHKKVNTYDAWGRLIRQDHYDSNNQYAYFLAWEYTLHGKISKETDAMGNSTERKYDANDNLIEEIRPRGDRTVYTYDFMNRLIKETEVHPDGVTLEICHGYDLLGNRIYSIDPYNNKAEFSYDAFGRIIKIEGPALLNLGNMPYRPEVSREYDIFGNVTYETDARKNLIRKSYTIRNQPVDTIYADGSFEKNRYLPDGRLNISIAKNQTKTFYSYDFADCIVRQQIRSQDDEFLSETSSYYNTFHLLREADAKGVLTHYTYYYNGKLKSKAKGDRLTTYEYDSLGRLIKTCDSFGSKEAVLTVQTYDLLDRVLSEQVEDSAGNIQRKVEYAYDVAGNCTMEATYVGSQLSATFTEYNSRNLPIKVTDAQGNVTMTTYRYDYHNSFGQCVPYKEITDPKGIITSVVEDAYGNIVQISKRNAQGITFQKQTYFYDANGNQEAVVETVFSPDAPEREVITQWIYDSMNRVVKCIEAVSTPEQKTTQYTYNQHGQKETIVKPDGTSILHSYDYLGRLSAIKAMDNSVIYNYEYDLNDNLTKVIDLVNNTVTLKTYDIHNGLLTETLGNGLHVAYSYDTLGRPSTITLPDNSHVSYVYQGANLAEVKRGKYSHKYKEYDLSGNVLSAQLIGAAGTLSTTYDTLDRVTGIETSFWKQSITAYDALGNLLSREVEDEQSKTSCVYAYDELNQLKSEKGQAVHDYVHDSLYNRLAKDNLAHSVNSLNQLLHDSESPYTYDLNGNRLSNGSIAYEYDALDRLIGAVNGDTRTEYTYDAENRRLSKSVFEKDRSNWRQVSTTDYLYLGQNEVGAYKNGVCTEFRVLGSGMGAEIGAAVAIEIGGKIYAPVHDHIGNVVCLLEADTGKVFETYRYTAFGELLFTPTINSWLFASKRYETETELVYFGSRYYDPVAARWLTPDPIAQEGGPNLYAYVLNSPLTHFDEYGFEPETIEKSPDNFANRGPSDNRSWFSRVGDFLHRHFIDRSLGYMHGHRENLMHPLKTSREVLLMDYEYNHEKSEEYNASVHWGKKDGSAIMVAITIVSGFVAIEYAGAYVSARLSTVGGGAALIGLRQVRNVSTRTAQASKILKQLNTAPLKGIKKQYSSNKIAELQKKISGWLGNKSKMIKNEAGEPIFISQDKMRQIRFDFNRPYPHKSPHMHVEEKIGNKWYDSGQIYPTDVPHL